MSALPIYLAFLWHQHQPYYKDEDQQIYILPWVRFHGLKDYFDMIEILDHYLDIKQNFNLVPSLLIQLCDYVENNAEDQILRLTLTKPEDLTTEQKAFILKHFFMANREQMIKPYPRYWELWQKHQINPGQQRMQSDFSNQDFRDLQVWYNLCWTGEAHKSKSPFIDLIKKNRNFTETDKQTLITAQRDILAAVIPKHKQAASRGQIELSVSPFYHPILPLLCDTDIAKISMPSITLPLHRFSYPEDANSQLEKAKLYFENLFQIPLRGIWPSEGSISEQVLELAIENGIQWAASDEEILFQSLRLSKSPQVEQREVLYQSYVYETEKGKINLFFRDHTLSDLIGFVYQNWEAKKAATDFVSRVLQIRERILQTRGEEYLAHSIVSVILDGENCWEFYPHNGRPFLQALYERLSQEPLIQTITFSEFIKTQQDFPRLASVFPGSWINHNFSIWIGHPEDNLAWEYLYQTRQALKTAEQSGKYPPEILQKAKEEIFIAEGSDWWWWYGDDHSTENAKEFDALFRNHLIHVFKILGQDAPPLLYHPIHKDVYKKVITVPPKGFIEPVLDGLQTNYFEWLGAGIFDVTQRGTAMHQTSQLIYRIYFGFNLESCYFRIDPKVSWDKIQTPELELVIEILRPKPYRLVFGLTDLLSGKSDGMIWHREKDSWLPKSQHVTAGYKDFFETGVPFKLIEASTKEVVGFRVRIFKAGNSIETWPENELILFQVPDEDFERYDWQV